MCSFAPPRSQSQPPKGQCANAAEFKLQPERWLQPPKVPFAEVSPDRHCCPFRWARLCEAGAQDCSGAMTYSKKLRACEKLAFHKNSRVAMTAAATWGTEHHSNGQTQRPCLAEPEQLNYMPDSLPGPRRQKLERILSDSFLNPSLHGYDIASRQESKEPKSSSVARALGSDIGKASDTITMVSAATTCARSHSSCRCKSCGCQMKGSSRSRSSSRVSFEHMLDQTSDELHQTPRSRRTVASSNTPEKSSRAHSLPTIPRSLPRVVGPDFCRVNGLPVGFDSYKTLAALP